MSTAVTQNPEDVDFSAPGSILDGNAGAALNTKNGSWNSLWAAISVALATAGIQMLVFILLRWRLTRIYRPRTYLVPERERVAIPPHGIIGWIKPVFTIPSLQLIQKCGLDAYFFIRYLRMLLKIFAPMLVIVAPILLPINATSDPDGSGKNVGLARLTIGNVGSEFVGSRLWAHLILAVLSILWILYNIYYELRSYIRVRQAYLTSPQHRIRASATTVLVTGIPAKWLTIQALDGLYDVFPGGIRNIWINRNYDEIADKISKRDDMVQSLEEAETNLIRLCRKKHEKQMKQQAKENKKNGVVDSNIGQEMSSMDGTKSEKGNTPASGGLDIRPDPPRIPSNYAESGGQIPAPPDTLPANQGRPQTRDSNEELLRGSQETAVEQAVHEMTEPKETPGQVVSGSKWYEKLMFWNTQPTIPTGGYPAAMSKDFDDDKDENATWRKYITDKERETIRLPVVKQDWFPALPWVGEKVDRIYHCRRELARLNSEIEADQANAESYPYMNSAFIQFNHQVAAHMACQSVSHHTPHTMAPRIVEISPNDVLWDNMSIKWWERYIRIAFVVAISIGLIILYAVPVAFTTLLSNISALAEQITWLGWLDDFPEIAKSIIQGVLPPAILQLVLILLPIIYRALVKFQGVPTGNDREMGVQKWYFVFLFIQVFLVVTVSNGLIKFFTQAATDVVGQVTRLAQNLPNASFYFFQYLMLRSFASAAGELLQIGTLIMWFLLGPLLDNTPRQKWKRQTNLQQVKWGSFFAPFSNFAVIGIVYCIFAPLMLVFMVIIFSLFWVVNRYNVLYVYQFKEDTGGLLFPTAIYQLFTGVYVMEACLAAFFFAAEDSSGSNTVCLPQAIIMVVVLILTIIFQRILINNFAPLMRYLPITLEDDAVIRDEEFARAQAARWETPGAERQEDESDVNFEQKLKDKERDEQADDKAVPSRTRTDGTLDDSISKLSTPSNSWAKRDEGAPSAWRKAAQPVKGVIDLTSRAEKRVERTVASANAKLDRSMARANGANNIEDDEEGHRNMGDVLFAGIADELEDLSPDERNLLVRYAFQHSALRARRPVVWFPEDALGVSADEVERGKAASPYLALSNQGTGLDKKGKVVFARSPPDFSNVDLIAL